MKKRILLFFTALLAVLTFASFNSGRAKAASWGATKVFTTPKSTRGTWYYKEDGKVKTLRITAHAVNGVKTYKVLRGKAEKKWNAKFAKADEKSDFKLENKVSTKQLEAYTYKYRGITGFNANGWLAGTGNGFYYVPVKRTVKGKKVKALRVGSGVKNYLSYYAYKSKKLAK